MLFWHRHRNVTACRKLPWKGKYSEEFHSVSFGVESSCWNSEHSSSKASMQYNQQAQKALISVFCSLVTTDQKISHRLAFVQDKRCGLAGFAGAQPMSQLRSFLQMVKPTRTRRIDSLRLWGAAAVPNGVVDLRHFHAIIHTTVLSSTKSKSSRTKKPRADEFCALGVSKSGHVDIESNLGGMKGVV